MDYIIFICIYNILRTKEHDVKLQIGTETRIWIKWNLVRERGTITCFYVADVFAQRAVVECLSEATLTQQHRCLAHCILFAWLFLALGPMQSMGHRSSHSKSWDLLSKVENSSIEVNFWWILKNCFLLTALLLEPISISFMSVKSILKQKNGQKWPKKLELCHWKFECTCCFHGDISITKNSSWDQNKCRQ